MLSMEIYSVYTMVELFFSLSCKKCLLFCEVRWASLGEKEEKQLLELKESRDWKGNVTLSSELLILSLAPWSSRASREPRGLKE